MINKAEITPGLSIIIPVYNVADYLPGCLDSILFAEDREIEVLLIDDGSTDGSGEICDRYSIEDERVKVIHKVNGGVSSARNLGLEKATGDWITFIDSDDYIDSGLFDDFRESICRTEASVLIYYNHFFVVGDKISASKTRYGSDTISTDSFIKYLLSYHEPSISVMWNKFFRRDLLSPVRFDADVKIGEDLLFLLEVVLQKQASDVSILLRDAPYYFYRVRAGSAMSNALESSFEKLSGLAEHMVSRYDRTEQYRSYLDLFTLLNFYLKIVLTMRNVTASEYQALKKLIGTAVKTDSLPLGYRLLNASFSTGRFFGNSYLSARRLLRAISGQAR